MTAKRFVFVYALSLYALISVVLVSAQFFAAEALVYLLFRAAHLQVCSGVARLIRMPFYDSAGFAFLAAANAVLQYYLASLLSRDLKDRSAAFGVLMISAGVSALFFLRLSAGSGLGAYAFASAPLMFSCLLGGMTGLLQKEADHPFRGSKLKIFSID
jgi:hypothetical protein